LKCELVLRSVCESPSVFLAVDIRDLSLTPIMQALPATKPFIPGCVGARRVVLEIELPPLIPGHYTADFWIGPHFSNTTDYIKNAVTFEISDSPSEDRNCPHSQDHGFLVPVSRCRYLAR
jgi:hypothetical protein